MFDDFYNNNNNNYFKSHAKDGLIMKKIYNDSTQSLLNPQVYDYFILITHTNIHEQKYPSYNKMHNLQKIIVNNQAT